MRKAWGSEMKCHIETHIMSHTCYYLYCYDLWHRCKGFNYIGLRNPYAYVQTSLLCDFAPLLFIDASVC